jgi:hypothetical protein
MLNMEECLHCFGRPQKDLPKKKNFTGRALTQPRRRHCAETFYFGGAMAHGGSKWPALLSVWR